MPNSRRNQVKLKDLSTKERKQKLKEMYCSWCPKSEEEKKKLTTYDEDNPISHTMCPACAKKQAKEWGLAI